MPRLWRTCTLGCLFYARHVPKTALRLVWLQELCVKAVASVFEQVPELKGLDKATTKKIIDILPLDLPLELAGTVSAAFHCFFLHASLQVTTSTAFHNALAHASISLEAGAGSADAVVFPQLLNRVRPPLSPAALVR